MALQTANQFNTMPNIAGSLQAGIQGGQNIANQFQLGGERVAAQKVRTDDEKNRSLVNSALRVSTMPEAEIIPFLESNIANVQGMGGDAAESMKALEMAQAGRFDELREGSKRLVDIGVRQGIIKGEAGAAPGFTLGNQRFSANGDLIATGQENGGKTGLVSAKTEIFDNGTTLSVLPTGETQVTDPSGKVVGGEERTKVLSTARQEQVEFSGKAEEIKLQKQLKLKPLIEGEVEKKKGDVKAAGDVVVESFKRIGNISSNMRNIDRAINAIDRGANTGVIAKLVPNIKAASRELRQIQNELGLDIIGSVTFGALSEGELNLALDTAIDLGLEPEALKDVLNRKKEAQNKLIGYLDEQIQFLDGGGTLAGWRESKKAAADTGDLGQLSDEQLAAEIAKLQGVK
jgi:hypothetical protein